jgi:hypothetical protein
MIAVTERTGDEVAGILAEAWHAQPETIAIASTCAAEHMRALLYGASVAPAYAAAPRTVHTTKLLSAARRVTSLLWPQLAPRTGAEQPAYPDLCALTLDHLAALGDAVSLPGGQWLASPLRLIVGAENGSLLLVGTAPNNPAEARLKSPLTCAAASRFVGRAPLQINEHQEILQPIDAWLGDEDTLQHWTMDFLARHEGRMEAAHGVSADQLEVYAPDIAQKQRRPSRWLPAVHITIALEGTRLCRPMQHFARIYDRPSFLAQFALAHGGQTVRRSTMIDRSLEHRLCFGMDARLGTQRRVALVAFPTHFVIERPLRLPQSERRVYALGWNDPTSGVHPEKLVFSSHALPFVLHALSRLNVTPVITTRERTDARV